MVIRLIAAVLVFSALGWVGRAVYLELEQESTCSICHRALHEHSSFRIHLRDGEINEVCCPRCGLRFMQTRDDVVSSEIADYNTGERFDAEEAFYVENSSVNLCAQHMIQKDHSGAEYELAWDRCLPSLIAFSSREAAEAFRRKKGGEVKVYGELLLEEP